MREEITQESSSEYYLDLKPVETNDLRTNSSRLCHIDVNRDEPYVLCKCCKEFLAKHTDADKKKHASDWKNTYAAFMWSMLAGKDGSTGWSFQRDYSPQHLWRFVPDKLRPFWVRAIRGTLDFSFHEHCEIIHGGGYPEECTVSNPPSFFVDRTTELREFKDAIESYKVKSFLEALSPENKKSIMLPDVSCPWGCTEFCFRCSDIPFYLLAQHHLRKVQLNLPDPSCYDKLYLIETSRDDYIRLEGEEQDRVILNGEWPICPTVLVSENGGLVVLTCR